MLIREDSFKGLIPKISQRALPRGNGTVVKNCRLRTGDLEPYRAQSYISTLNKTGPLSTIYPLDRDGTLGGPFWFSWKVSQTASDVRKVDAVRTPILTDIKEQTIFTSAANDDSAVNLATDYVPKITNLDYGVTSGPGMDTGYPYNWYYLGIPAPLERLTVTQDLPLTFSYINVGEGGDLTGWTVSPLTANSVIMKDDLVGNPAPSFSMFNAKFDTTALDPCYFYRNAGVAFSGPGGIQFDVLPTATLTPNPAIPDLSFSLGSNSIGDGFSIGLFFDTTGGKVFLGTKTTWESSQSSPVVYDTLPMPATHIYGLRVEYIPVEGDLTKYNATITLTDKTDATTVLQVQSVITSKGGYIGWSIFGSLGPNTYQTHIDNIQQASLLNTPGIEATSWVFTYVNALGQEGPPNPATGVYFIGDSVKSTLSNFMQTIPPGFGITSINLYRTSTGSGATLFQFDMNLPLDTVTYVDEVPTSSLGETLQSANYDMPPADGKNVIALPNGIVIMSSGSTIAPSVQYQPHAYPQTYRLATELPVVALVAVETTAVALTLDAAYLIIGSDPSALSMSKIGPQYGCISKESAVRWENFGVVYASSEGLVLVNSGGSRILTQDYITLREWNETYNPSTIQGAIYENMYYALYRDNLGQQKAFIFDTRDGGIGFIDIDLSGTAIFSEHYKEDLYVAVNSDLFQWDIGDYLTAVWRSKVYELPYPTSFNAAQVRMDNPANIGRSTAFNLYKNREASPFYSKIVTDSKEFVVNPTVCFDIQLELQTRAIISQAQLAEDMNELG